MLCTAPSHSTPSSRITLVQAPVARFLRLEFRNPVTAQLQPEHQGDVNPHKPLTSSQVRSTYTSHTQQHTTHIWISNSHARDKRQGNTDFTEYEGINRKPRLRPSFERRDQEQMSHISDPWHQQDREQRTIILISEDWAPVEAVVGATRQAHGLA